MISVMAMPALMPFYATLNNCWPFRRPTLWLLIDMGCQPSSPRSLLREHGEITCPNDLFDPSSVPPSWKETTIIPICKPGKPAPYLFLSPHRSDRCLLQSLWKPPSTSPHLLGWDKYLSYFSLQIHCLSRTPWLPWENCMIISLKPASPPGCLYNLSRHTSGIRLHLDRWANL